MEQLTPHQWIEAIGYLASALTVATYAMNTMLPLRLLAIGSSVSFLIYGAILQIWPLLAMELLLLPINVYRLWQLLSLRGRLNGSTGDAPDFSVIKTYGKPRTLQAGTVIFERGAPVDCLYFLENGRVRIDDFDVTLGPGNIFGEIAFFTQAAERTATARCVEISKVYEIDEKRFMRLQFEDPSFGLSVMRTLTQRLTSNVARFPGPHAQSQQAAEAPEPA